MIRPWDGCKKEEGDGWGEAEPVILLLGKEKRSTFECISGGKQKCLMFMCPCITSIIINDDQQVATILDLLISSLLYMFRAIYSPIIRST
jgi:hypothetical protein